MSATAPDAPESMVSGFGQYHSDEPTAERRTPYAPLTMAAVWGMLEAPQAVEKQRARWLIPSTLQTRAFSEQEARGQYLALWADLDENPQPIQRVAQALSGSIIPGAQFMVYASRSATVERQKARVIVPLARALSWREWSLAQAVLNDKLQAGGMTPDRANERAAQLCYLPNRGAFYDCASVRDSGLFDPMAAWAGEVGQKLSAIAQAERESRARIEANKARRQHQLAQRGESPIDAFNAAFPVEEILLSRGYAQRGSDFRHPGSESGSFSASVKAGRVYALSPSDPLYTGHASNGAHDAFSAFCVLEHSGDQGKALRAAAELVGLQRQHRPNGCAIDPDTGEVLGRADQGGRDETRRRLQQEENAKLQDDCSDILPPSLSVDDMLADCVWVAEGSQVGRLSAPKRVLSFGEFRDLTASSATEVEEEGRTKPRKVPNAVLWKNSPARKTVHARTFHAGAPEICRDPDGELALNSWRPIERQASSTDVQPFLDHVVYLIEDATEREVFLDWLGHIEQRPGVLPHYGWLHIAQNTGTGRNWLASVLARVWRGYVAPNVDLPALLESQFNGALSGRVLAMVDEVQEGGGENPFRHANRLKSLVNAEERTINPKFGRQYREHNACRWLVFSNHDNALPLNDSDRRWRVVRHDAAPRSPETYARLYRLLGDAEFINAVGSFLRVRDITQFNPGERPPMSAAKRAVLSASKSTVQTGAEELVRRWPADVITNSDAAQVLGEGRDGGFTPAMRRALAEAGAVQYGNGRTVKVQRQVSKCWILRDPGRWSDVSASVLAGEAARARECGGSTALEVLAASNGCEPF